MAEASIIKTLVSNYLPYPFGDSSLVKAFILPCLVWEDQSPDQEMRIFSKEAEA